MRLPRTRALRAGLAAAAVLSAFATAAGADTLTVTTLDDDAVPALPGSLRDAIERAMANDVIVFDPGVTGTITLESDLGPLPNGLTLDATSPSGLTIAGPTYLVLDLDDVGAIEVTAIDLNTNVGTLIQIGDGDVLTFTTNTDATIASIIADTAGAVTGGSIIKDGTAVLRLSGATSTFSGVLRVDEGIVIGDADSLPDMIDDRSIVVFEQGSNATYSGIISGTGSVEKTGAGDLTFDQAHTYSGGTTVREGALIGDTTSLQGDIEIESTGELRFDIAGGAPETYAGVLSGDGMVTKDGVDDLMLTGTNTVFSGTLDVLDGGVIGTTSSIGGSTVNLETNTTLLTFDQDANGGFGGSITGAGSLVKDGTGSVSLTGNNSYTGTTTVMDGTLVVTTNSLPSTSDATVEMDATLIFDQAFSGTYTGIVSGAGDVAKQGTGTVTWTGAHSYTGATTISGGALAVDGSIASAVDVAAGGTLGGTGTVNAPVSVAGAVAPALSAAGTLTVDDVDFDAGSQFVVDASDDGSADDQLLVTGGTSFDATSQLVVNTAPGSYADVEVDILVSGGAIGTLPNVNETVFLTFTPTEPVPGTLRITIDGVVDDLELLGQTPNQKAVGAALDRFTSIMGNPPELTNPDVTELFDNMIGFDSDAEVQATLDSLSGESITAFTTARQALAERTQRTLHRRMRSVLFESADAWPKVAPGRTTTRRTGTRDVAAAWPSLGERGVGGWLDGFGVIGDVDGDGNTSDVEYDLYGASAGLDFRLGERALAGFSAGYARTDVELDHTQDGNADTVQGGVYAAYATSRVFAGVSGRYAWTQADSKRTIEAGGFSEKARGDFDSHDYGARGELAVTAYETHGVRFQPLAALDWLHLSRESFTESGAGSLGLDVDSETLDSTLLQVGARIDALFAPEEGLTFAPELHAFWLHEFGDRARELDAAIAGAPFTVEGAEVPRDSALVGVGWGVSLGPNFRATANYDLRIDSDRTENIGGVRLYLRF